MGKTNYNFIIIIIIIIITVIQSLAESKFGFFLPCSNS